MVSFGSFDYFCQQAPLILCPLVGNQIVEPTCYARNVDVNGTLLFQPATLMIHVISLIMTAIMIYHIKIKYTAVGRKEMLLFFYLYGSVVLLEFFLLSGLIPFATVSYKVNVKFLLVGIFSFLYWHGHGNDLVFIFEWIYWISMGRRWNFYVVMGTFFSLMR
jgi:hypothetical protein